MLFRQANTLHLVNQKGKESILTLQGERAAGFNALAAKAAPSLRRRIMISSANGSKFSRVHFSRSGKARESSGGPESNHQV